MLKTRVMPCLLLNNARLVKTVRFKEPKYVGDPVNAVKIYNEKEVDELVFLDITASVENRRPSYKIISEIASECFMPFAYGGGIRSIEDIREVFRLGVEKVVVNSYAVENPEFLSRAADLFGSQSIVVSLDVKKNFFGKYELYTHGGKNNARLDPVEFAAKVEKMGAGEIFLNSIDRDGTMQGYDIELIQKVCNAVKLPVVACGGAGKTSDLHQAVKVGGASAVAIGSMAVYQGPNRAVLINFPTRNELAKYLD